MTATTPIADDPTREYGSKIVAVEPGGVEFIPLDERHGKPIALLWTWVSPNMEFATIGVGILGPLFFGLTFGQTVLAIVLGTALGSVTQAVLSAWGPEAGLTQMVLSRTGFGFLGNILPAGINAVVAGAGWFAVNSISGALALHALVDALPKQLCLLIIVALEITIAFLGHNLIHAFERFAFPVLAVVFVIGCVIAFGKTNGDFKPAYDGGIGGFLILFGATFGYAAGWNPYASDYTRYLPRGAGRLAGVYAGLGIFVSCVLLESAGAAAVTVSGKSGVSPDTFTNLLPTWLGKLTLLCIALGAIAANAINMYSGAISVMALGIRLPTQLARGAVALALGVVGTVIAFVALDHTASYENFLLVIAYWVGPWLGVVLVDRLLRRGTDSQLLMGRREYTNWAGPIAMLVGGVLSIWLFSNQTKYVGPLPKAHPSLGDLTFEVGFAISAVLYFVLFKLTKPELGPVATESKADPSMVE